LLQRWYESLKQPEQYWDTKFSVPTPLWELWRVVTSWLRLLRITDVYPNYRNQATKFVLVRVCLALRKEPH